MCFYGLSFNSGKQDLFKGTTLMAGVEVLAYFIILFTIDIGGRRPVLSICQILAGLSCLCSPTSSFSSPSTSGGGGPCSPSARSWPASPASARLLHHSLHHRHRGAAARALHLPDPGRPLLPLLAYFIILFTIDIGGRRPVLSICQIL